MSSYKLVCPHCTSRMRIRTSEGRHVFLRVAYLQCVNEACGWSVRAEFEMTHELSPSGMPNPDVQLPSANRELRHAAHNPGPSGKSAAEPRAAASSSL
ncbi:ogr/Delta-like zinc finger family protein [Pseudomonas plecoglossicida]|uniref:ogr/Delta-like zinc finger family protein n=1 Tax=Pseudomonas plecoglossicida TaxID=70775 RepID=UPI00280B1303|nr:ogr/Delta-like zinc finger family protein [Pseudomonas plecoglossicida]